MKKLFRPLFRFVRHVGVTVGHFFWVIGSMCLLRAGWRQVRLHWFSASLMVACSLFLADGAVEWLAGRRAAVEYQNKVAETVQKGGGILVNSGALECVGTLDAVADIVESVTKVGVAATGLVIGDGVNGAVLDAVLAKANQRFRHESVSWNAVRRIVGVTGTPVFLGIGADGNVAFVEHVSSIVRANPDGPANAADRLAARLDVS